MRPPAIENIPIVLEAIEVHTVARANPITLKNR